MTSEERPSVSSDGSRERGSTFPWDDSTFFVCPLHSVGADDPASAPTSRICGGTSSQVSLEGS